MSPPLKHQEVLLLGENNYIRLGSRGGVTQIRVEFMDDQSRSFIRNVKGPGMLCSSREKGAIG